MKARWTAWFVGVVLLAAALRYGVSREGGSGSRVVATVESKPLIRAARERPDEALMPSQPAHGSVRSSEGVQATPGHDPVSPGELRLELGHLTRLPWKRPSPEALDETLPEDLEAVLALYLAATEVTNRVAATFLLTKLGGERVVAAFTNTLGSEFAGRALNGREYRCMELTLHMLGVLAGSSSTALDFLKAGRSVEWWSDFRKWRNAAEADDEIRQAFLMQMSSIAWSSLGFANLPEIERERLAERESPMDDQLFEIASGLGCGAFYRDWVSEAGPYGVLRTMCLGGDPGQELFREWKKGNKGVDWTQWYDGLTRHVMDSRRTQ